MKLKFRLTPKPLKHITKTLQLNFGLVYHAFSQSCLFLFLKVRVHKALTLRGRDDNVSSGAYLGQLPSKARDLDFSILRHFHF